MLNNVLAAAAATHVAGVQPEAMVKALRGFHGLPHVMEPVADVHGVRFVNDSKATNVEAARRSIESFEHGVVAIVGGRYKAATFVTSPSRWRREGARSSPLEKRHRACARRSPKTCA